MFGGKELQTDLDLGWLDFHTRQYDPTIGRMLSVDPLSELAFEWTPFRFGYNNPIRFTDPSGMTEEDESRSTQEIVDDLWEQAGESGTASWTNPNSNSGSSSNCPPGQICETDKDGNTKVLDEDGNVQRVIPKTTDADIAFDAIAQTGDLLAGAAAGAAAETVLFLIGEYAVIKVIQGGRWVYKIVQARKLTKASVTDKLSRYLLNSSHPVGGSKAKWFDQALGFTKNNMDDLAKQIVFNNKTAVVKEVTKHGTKYNQVIPITGANGKVINVTFAWIKNNDDVVRLVTAIPK